MRERLVRGLWMFSPLQVVTRLYTGCERYGDRLIGLENGTQHYVLYMFVEVVPIWACTLLIQSFEDYPKQRNRTVSR
jgi:hypothetical protein